MCSVAMAHLLALCLNKEVLNDFEEKRVSKFRKLY
jgi:hypothetical protein